MKKKLLLKESEFNRLLENVINKVNENVDFGDRESGSQIKDKEILMKIPINQKDIHSKLETLEAVGFYLSINPPAGHPTIEGFKTNVFTYVQNGVEMKHKGGIALFPSKEMGEEKIKELLFMYKRLNVPLAERYEVREILAYNINHKMNENK